MAILRSLMTLILWLNVALPLHAQIYRWNNGQMIPGTAGITLGPSVQLSGWNTEAKNLRFGNFQANLIRVNFQNSWLDEARFNWANLTGVSLTGANLTGAGLYGSTLTKESM